MSRLVEHDTIESVPAFTRDTSTSDEAASDAEWLRAQLNAQVGPLHRVVRHLASGGMGHVFMAEHSQLGAHAAVKLPRSSHGGARAGIAQEAALLSQLQHPNIVSVLDAGEMADGTPYLLMEYVGGLSLDAWIDSCGPMSPKRCIGILKQVASAVDYLHARDIVHSDIKPANIIVDPRANDFVKLVDFGIAIDTQGLAARRGLMGTPAYMAPEQARGEACGPAIDIYGVAALALELLTGSPPFDADSAQEALTAILTQPAPLPSSRGLCVAELDEVFARSLHSEPAQRHASASQFVAELEYVFEQAELRSHVSAALVLEPVPSAPDVASARLPTDPRAATIKSRSGWHAFGNTSKKQSLVPRCRGLVTRARAALRGLRRAGAQTQSPRGGLSRRGHNFQAAC